MAFADSASFFHQNSSPFFVRLDRGAICYHRSSHLLLVALSLSLSLSCWLATTNYHDHIVRTGGLHDNI